MARASVPVVQLSWSGLARPSSHPPASGACRSLDPRDKPEDDIAQLRKASGRGNGSGQRPLFRALAQDANETNALPRVEVGGKPGLLPFQQIAALRERKKIDAPDGIAADQIQPASIDLRLARKAYRVRSSFLPGKARTVLEQLEDLKQHEFSLDQGAVLEHGCVYVVKLQETLDLPPSISAVANPKSSTGRIDVFTRLISDRSEAFDWVEAKYTGELFAEIFPRTFSIKVRTGTRLNQLRFLRRSGSQDRYWRPELSDAELRKLDKKTPLVDGEPGRATIRNGLNVGVDLKGEGSKGLVGYRARKFADVLDVEQARPRQARLLGADPRQQGRPPHPASQRVLHPGLARAAAGAARVRRRDDPHRSDDGRVPRPLRGLLRSGLRLLRGWWRRLQGGARGAHLGDPVRARARADDRAARLRGAGRAADQALRVQGIASHYQGQGLKLSKHFK